MKYIYMLLTLDPRNGDSATKALNAKATDGWRVVGVVSYGEGFGWRSVYTLEKKVEDD